MGALLKAYLVAYNAASMLGWAALIAVMVSHFLEAQDASTAYRTLYLRVQQHLKIVQTAALLEVVHALLRMVRSPVFTTGMQVASRLLVLWGISHVSPPSQVHWAFALMAFSWSLVEVPRYGFYIWKLLVDSDPAPTPKGAPPAAKTPSNVPYWLTWLRYSLFIVLYPTGITGESRWGFGGQEPARGTEERWWCWGGRGGAARFFAPLAFPQLHPT